MNIWKRQELEGDLHHLFEHSGIIDFRLHRMLVMCQGGEKESRWSNTRLHLNKRPEDHLIRSSVCDGLFCLANLQLKQKQSTVVSKHSCLFGSVWILKPIKMNVCLFNVRIYIHDLRQVSRSKAATTCSRLSHVRNERALKLSWLQHLQVATILKEDIAHHQSVCLTNHWNTSVSVIMVFLSTAFRTERIGF